MQLRTLIYPAFLLVCFLVFAGTADYGYITDYLGWLNAYRSGSFKDVLTCFGYPGNHQFFHLINYLLYLLVGKHQMIMGFIFIFTHASVSYLVYRTFRTYLEGLGLDQGGLIALFTAMFTALSPYAIEVITWDACYHYLMVTGLVFGAGNVLLGFWKHGKPLLLYLHFILFFLSLYTLELGLVAPGIFTVYAFLWFYAKKDMPAFWRYFVRAIPIYLLLLAFYFISTKWMIGAWVGHYGAEQHLKFDFFAMLSTWAKYLVKQIFLVHFWKFTWKESLYAMLDQKTYLIGFFLLILVAIGFLLRNSRGKIKGKVVVTGLIAFGVALLPVLNLFFVWIGWYENDRYSYFAAPHIYLVLTTLVTLLFKKRYGLVWLAILAINCVFLGKIIHTVNQAGKLSNKLSSSFDFYDNDEVVLLCTPENIHGALLFRDYSDTGITLNESLDWLGNGLYKGKMTSLVQWNPTTKVDSLAVKILTPNSLQIDIASWGTWFWRKGLGLTNFETDRYKVSNNGLSFTVEVKDTVKNRVFIFNKGTHWDAIKLPIDEN